MAKFTRFAVSLEESLFGKLDDLVRKHRYTNRSEYIRDLIRARLVEDQWADEHAVVIGTLTLIYDHHAYQLTKKLTDLQHHHHKTVLATTHVHLDQHLCSEMIMLKGHAAELREIADLSAQQRGVLHATLSISSAGRGLH
ncbi:MAG: nickel-responsive transcriptional regulator NikR [Tepidisphaeraceae bacterium]|jgi:CopG family nickel-responsive transcriptional regulator